MRKKNPSKKAIWLEKFVYQSPKVGGKHEIKITLMVLEPPRS